jgi:IS5 family transposase
MDRNYLESRSGDRINAVLAAGYNFGLLLRWLAELLRPLVAALFAMPDILNAP